MDEGLRVLWVGIGCQRGVSKLAIGRAIEWVFTRSNLDLATIAGLATIDRKADEPGLLDYCRESGWFLKIYTPEQLNLVVIDRLKIATLSTLNSPLGALTWSGNPTGAHPQLSTPVAEAAALCAAGSDILLIPKQKFRLDSESGWVTIAVARSFHFPLPRS
jgi:cobalamin biosynthesis protein CbiG